MHDPVDPAAAWDGYRDTVQPEWIDYNGHMNVAFYVLVFDRATDALFDRLGIGDAYRAQTGCTIFAAETHVLYKAEVKLGDPLKIQSLLLGADAKRVHLFHRMFHADTEILAATLESLGLNVDGRVRRVVPFAADVAKSLHAAVMADARLPRPSEIGRRISPLPGPPHFIVP